MCGRRTVMFWVLLLGVVTFDSSAPATQSTTGVRPADDRSGWYRDAKFGMFVHWGPYSLASVEASWPIMTPDPKRRDNITEAEYRALPSRFNPTRFDPVAWIRLAKAAGQRYLVFTSKHHDGFCMFDSAYTNYKITQTPYGKDILAQLAEACRRENMPLGFYYSPPDMNHTGFRDTSKLARDNWAGEPWRAEWPLYLDYMELQLSELLTRYGDVRIIWFDGLGHQEKYNGARFLKLIHELQPASLVNNRIGLPADYETPEQFIPQSIPTKGHRLDFDNRQTLADPGGIPRAEDFRLWETCMTINDTWAYNANDKNYKSATVLIRSLVEVASKGGNFLLNVGPGPDGTIQPEFEERLRVVGQWLKLNGESIYGTTYGPWQTLPFGKTTAKGNKVYLHIFDWPNGKLEIKNVTGKVKSATLLVGGKTVDIRQTGDHLWIDLPAQSPDPHVNVIALEMD
jgi:alpha-L-fucosidase